MKKFSAVLAAILLVCTLLPTSAMAADFTPNPKTPYATTFITACEVTINWK